MGNPPFKFEHWQFDKNAQHCKPTDVWGNFKSPILKIKGKKPIMDLHRNYRTSNWQQPTVPKEYAHLKLDRAAIRAITPASFAKAFYEANS